MHDELSSYIEDGLCTSSGEPLLIYEDNAHKLELSHTFIPVENFNQFVINHQKGGEAYEVDSLQAGPYGMVALFLLSSYNSRFETIWLLSCNT